MRLRLAAVVLTAACGLFAPVRADEPARTANPPTADMYKYLPEGSGFYVHVNVRQLLASPLVRKAIPMAVDKYGDTIMQLAQLAKAFDPNAANIPNDKIKEMVDALKKPETIAKAFDAAKDALTDIVVAGDPGKDEHAAVVFKCHEAVSGDVVKTFAPLLQNNPQFQIKMNDVAGGKTMYEVQMPQSPKPVYFAIPENGIVVLSPQKALVEKALKGGGAGGMSPDLKKVAAERKKTDFVFFAVSGKGSEDNPVVSGWGRLVLDKDVSGEMSATFTNEKKAADEAKEINDHLGQLADTVKGALGNQGTAIADALNNAKATASGSHVTAKFTVPGSAIEKLLAKNKE
jgi:hypothetical protein